MKIIVLEGADGAGKSTAVDLVYEQLTKSGLNVKRLKNLPNTDLGKTTREYLSRDIEIVQVVQLMMASTMDLKQSIQELSIDTDVVIIDRWILSTLAYGRLDLANSNRRNDYNTNIMNLVDANMRLSGIKVDATIYLDVDIEISKARTAHRNENDIYTNKLVDIKRAYSVSIDEIRSNLTTEAIVENIGRIFTVDANEEIDVVIDDIVDIVNTLYTLED